MNYRLNDYAPGIQLGYTSGSFWVNQYPVTPSRVMICAYCGSEKEELRCDQCGASRNESPFPQFGQGRVEYHDDEEENLIGIHPDTYMVMRDLRNSVNEFNRMGIIGKIKHILAGRAI